MMKRFHCVYNAEWWSLIWPQLTNTHEHTTAHQLAKKSREYIRGIYTYSNKRVQCKCTSLAMWVSRIVVPHRFQSSAKLIISHRAAIIANVTMAIVITSSRSIIVKRHYMRSTYTECVAKFVYKRLYTAGQFIDDSICHIVTGSRRGVYDGLIYTRRFIANWSEENQVF